MNELLILPNSAIILLVLSLCNSIVAVLPLYTTLLLLYCPYIQLYCCCTAPIIRCCTAPICNSIVVVLPLYTYNSILVVLPLYTTLFLLYCSCMQLCSCTAPKYNSIGCTAPIYTSIVDAISLCQNYKLYIYQKKRTVIYNLSS